MKQSDIAIIIVVVAIGGVLSFFLSNFLFSGKQATHSTIVVDPIATTFQTPDERYFHAGAVDPTRPANTGAQANEQQAAQ